MGSEYFINSQELEDKVRQLLPSQGGAGAGFDLSASTQIIPIIDLTESAEGSNIRQDLQTSLSFKSQTSYDVKNTTSTIISNTGYYRILGTVTAVLQSGSINAKFLINDGASTKTIWLIDFVGTSVDGVIAQSYDFTVFLTAGDIFQAQTSDTAIRLTGSTRQIANIDGQLTNP